MLAVCHLFIYLYMIKDLLSCLIKVCLISFLKQFYAFKELKKKNEFCSLLTFKNRTNIFKKV